MSTEATNEKAKENNNKNALKTAGRGVKAYLSDWRNWLTHGLIGVAFVLAAVFAPVPIWIKIVVMLCVIVFNCVRMNLRKQKKEKEQAEKEKQEMQAEQENQEGQEG